MSDTTTDPSSIEIGDSFRDLVCELLRTQYPDAKPEQYLGGTKVDVLFSRLDFGKRERIAVECKNYEKALTKSYIEEKIYPKYQHLLAAGQIEGLIIVSNRPLGSAASDFVNYWRHARHLTVQELEESLLGIRQHVEGMAALQPTSDVRYVEARFDGLSSSALDNVQDWVNSGQENGLALLGSYGQGKTSLARRIAGHYAASYMSDPTGRIPILKTLGDVVHETRIEALFGALFTADQPAPGYQFKTFDHLNQAGRLLVILDGFDEMKHAMTASDFFSNFREFNRLLKGNSKVLLLGRPNALPSDAQDLVFRGIRMVSGQEVLSSEFSRWKEWTLAFFSEDESSQLLKSTLATLVSRLEWASRYTYTTDFVANRTNEVLARVPSELLRRPVHVQLISELAANPGFDFEGFNQYSLYQHFIKSMVERDTTEKRARKAIPLESRLQFQRDLAWWAWRRQGKVQGSFLRDEIPDVLLDGMPAGNAADAEGKRNEYIVSTLTEEKESGVLYFAHRSFQEFLVADRLRLSRPDVNQHVEYARHMTPDLMTFLYQAPDLEFIFDWYDTLRECTGPLDRQYLQFFGQFDDLVSFMKGVAVESPATVDVWTVSILAFASATAVERPAFSRSELIDYLHRVIRIGTADAAAVATLALMQLIDVHSQVDWLRVAGGLVERCLRRARPESDATALSIPSKQFDFAAKWLATSVEKVFPTHGSLAAAKLRIDISKLVSCCIAELQEKFVDSPWPLGMALDLEGETSVEIESGKAFAGIDREVREAHDAFLKARKTNFHIAAYEEKRAAWSGRPSTRRT